MSSSKEKLNKLHMAAQTLERAIEDFATADTLHRAASFDRTATLGALNAAQKEFDSCVKDIKDAPPYGTIWFDKSGKAP